MPVCVAVGCSNRSPRDTERGITFHRVPAGNESLKKEWLVKIKRVNLPKLSCCFLCSDHFEPNCFQVDYRHEFLGGSRRRRRLKETAVPIIFCHKNTEQKGQTSETRRRKAERHEVRLSPQKKLMKRLVSTALFLPLITRE